MKNFLDENVKKFKDFMSQNKISELLDGDKKAIRKFIGNYTNNFNQFENDEKALRVSGALDAFSALMKFLIGFLTGSIVIISSAVDCLADFFSSVFNIMLFRWSKKPSDEKYNYGYGKLQGFGAVVQSGLIMIATIFVIFESFEKLFSPEFKIKWLTLIIIVISFDIILVIANLFYHVSMTRGSQNMIIKSSIMKSFSALMVDLGILISFVIIKYFTHPPFYKLDPIVSLIISFIILFGLYKVVRLGMDMLLDKALDAEDLKIIEETIYKSSDKIRGHQNLKTRKSGENKFIDFDLLIDNSLSFDEVYYVCISVKENILTALQGSIVMINPLPKE